MTRIDQEKGKIPKNSPTVSMAIETPSICPIEATPIIAMPRQAAENHLKSNGLRCEGCKARSKNLIS